MPRSHRGILPEPQYWQPIRQERPPACGGKPAAPRCNARSVRPTRNRKSARLELDYARENPGVPPAQFEEGRLAVDALERARVLESAAWQRLYDPRCVLDKAKPALLHAAGDLLEAFAD